MISPFFLCWFVISVAVAASNDPRPNPNSVVTVAGRDQQSAARFTILTPRLIRMEWGQSMDSATLTFLNRYLPTPSYKVDHKDEWIVIETDFLKVHYLSDGSSFNEDNLYVEYQVNDETNKWKPLPYYNDSLGGNLLGTVRTLDGNNGKADLLNCMTNNGQSHCTLGLISRDGYVVVDDTGYPQFDDSDWPWVTAPPSSSSSNTSDQCNDYVPQTVRSCGLPSISETDCIGRGCCWSDKPFNDTSVRCYYTRLSKQDLYFFGHGHDYKAAMRDFTMVAGKIPLPPKYTFGVFYSRYWAYSDSGDMEVVNEYRSRKIPLDNLVTDMDWHMTFYKEAAAGAKDAAGQGKGWTGFTWDKHLFPNPSGFLAWCKANKLRNTLNVHPASGIQKWEETFSQMVKAMNMNESDTEYVPWKPTDPKFVNNFFEIVLKPLQDMGIDYWWLDWQQGESGEITGIDLPNVNPTFWINYIFFTNPYQWGGTATNHTKRPLLLHRWGGLGNHRYQIGFSGDVVPCWDSLHYQVYFTLRASNVLFGYWSHDLGGHTEPSPAELYTRWVQWGAFSPIFRTHCTKNARNDRRIWVYPLANYQIMREAIILRGSLVPYIYTHAREAYDTGLTLLRAMYFEYPEHDEAYIFDRQYFFGPDILVAPVTEPLDDTTQLINKTVWIPPGSYVSWTHGKLVKGPANITWQYTLYEIPLFVKSGSILPMLTDGYNDDPLGSAFRPVDSLKLMIFVGDSQTGSGYLYEDDGESEGYKNSNYTNTTFSFIHDTSGHTLTVSVDSASGIYSGFPSQRNYQISLPNFWPAEQVTVDGNDVSYCPLMMSFKDYTKDCWTYDGSSLSLIVNIVTWKSTSDSVKVKVNYDKFNVFDPYNINVNLNGASVSIGFTGMIKRLTNLKRLLDDQWGIDTVYQEDYQSLISASEAGNKITYTPEAIESVIQDFRNDFQDTFTTVVNLKVNSTLLTRLETQILPEE